MKLVLPLLLALIGAAAGIGAGLYLKPLPDPAALQAVAGDGPGTSQMPSDVHGGAQTGHDASSGGAAEERALGLGNSEFIKLNNQFVVPVLSDGRVKSMVVLSLSLETPLGTRELIYSQEPRIRDHFLQVLFDHANTGGFDGAFTNGANMDILRQELRRSGKQLLGTDIVDVLVTDIARQDLG